MQNTDVLAVPGEIRQDGAAGAKVRRVVLSLFNDDAGNMTLPDGSELSFPSGVAWRVTGKVSRARTGGGNEASIATFNIEFGVYRTGGDTVTLDSNTIPVDYSVSIVSTNTVRLSYSGFSADSVAHLDIVEIVRS
jgi:hypothetical protein